jgi:hypothetical protein
MTARRHFRDDLLAAEKSEAQALNANALIKSNTVPLAR